MGSRKNLDLGFARSQIQGWNPENITKAVGSVTHFLKIMFRDKFVLIFVLSFQQIPVLITRERIVWGCNTNKALSGWEKWVLIGLTLYEEQTLELRRICYEPAANTMSPPSLNSFPCISHATPILLKLFVSKITFRILTNTPRSSTTLPKFRSTLKFENTFLFLFHFLPGTSFCTWLFHGLCLLP